MPKNKDAFVEQSSVDTPRPQRLSLRLSPDGESLDLEATPSKHVAKLESLLKNDPTIQSFLSQQTAEQKALEITPAHVKRFMEGYAFVETLVMPGIIRARTKGAIVIPAPIAAAAYQFSEETKDRLAPAGAEWANAAFPDWLKEWLAKTGPGAVFFGGLFLASVAQTKVAIGMWQEAQLAKPQTGTEKDKANGHAEHVSTVQAEEVISGS